MNTLGAFIFASGGIFCIIWFRKLSDMLSAVFSKEFQRKFGSYATQKGWDDPKKPFNRFLYRLMVILFGLFLLLVSFHTYFWDNLQIAEG